VTAARPSGSGSSGSTEQQVQRMAIGSPRSGAVEHALGDLFSAFDVRINSGGTSSLSDHEVVSAWAGFCLPVISWARSTSLLLVFLRKLCVASWLLRARRQRPCRRRAAEQRDELASPHSITSSATASSVGGTSSPSACAVIKLMTSSNFVGCSTGISPGFVPRRILST
jgi:Flp pilus assembly protein TadB